MSLNNLKEALIHELQDILSAEKQLVEALPKMIKEAEEPQLQLAFESHLEETKGHVKNVEKAIKAIGGEAESHKCKAMAGILAEGEELRKEKATADVKDAMLIAAAQKVEHYEIASYGTVCTWCEQIGGLDEALELLRANMAQEELADSKLSSLAEQTINAEAVS